jgi:hypothetical protein
MDERKEATMRMMLIVIGAALGASAPLSHGQEPLWTQSMETGTAIWEVEQDGAGGVFAVGWTSQSIGAPNVGGDDIWVGRYARDGSRLWVRQFGSPADDYGLTVAPDGSGGLFIGGLAAADIGGGPGAAWLARYSGGGQRQWIIQLGIPGGGLQGSRTTALLADGQGGCFAAGRIDSAQQWLARFDPAGAQLWLRTYDLAHQPTSLVFDDVGGFFKGSLSYFNSGSVSRHDSDGEQQWHNWFGGPVWIRPMAFSLLPDGAGGVIATGWADHHPALGTGTFIAPFDSAGGPTSITNIWGQFAMTSDLDGAGGLLLAGTMLGRFDLQGNTLWLDPSWTNYARSISASSPRTFHIASSTGFYGEGDYFLHAYSACYANCDESLEPPVLNVADFACFLQRFAAGAPYANCDQSTAEPVLNVADFACFLQTFAAGCP